MKQGLANNFEGLSYKEAFKLLKSRYEGLSEENETLSKEKERLNTQYTSLHSQNNDLQKENFELKEENQWLKRQIFGSKRERYVAADTGQLQIWEDIGQGDHDEQQESGEEQETDEKVVKKRQKKRPSRAVLPGHLKRQEEIIEPSGDVSGGKKIGEEVTEILEYEPGSLYVKRFVRPKYALGEDKGVCIGELPSMPVPKGNVGPGLLAHLTVSKYGDHLPFYRQHQILERLGISIAESTINDWFAAGCQLLEPLYEVLRGQVQRSDYLMGDETPIPVLDSRKKGATHQGYHWVYYSPLDKLVCFDYREGRARDGPAQFLKGFQGYLQTDGYQAYDQFDKDPNIRLLGCMAHARRKFEHAQTNDRKRADYALQQIQKLYKIERRAKEEGLSYEARKELRKQEAMPILEQMGQWLQKQQNQVLPKSAIGKAITYSSGLWNRLMRYTEDGRFEIDNNLVENSIRPVALGRKNYLFAGSHKGAYRAAIIYSFLGTCKQNGVDPFRWLRNVFTRLPDQPVTRLEELLPQNWQYTQEEK